MSTVNNSIIPTTAPYSQDPRTVDSIPSSIVDWVLVELKSNPTAPADFAKSVFLHKNGSLVLDDGITPISLFDIGNGNYYIVIKHRNTIETWSSTKQQFDSSILHYDFTNDSSKAYGFNMIKKGTEWCIYTGDVNQDGLVDGSDMASVDNDNFNFVTGYVLTDFTGDQIVDGSDVAIADNNNSSFVSKSVPPSTATTKTEKLKSQSLKKDNK